MGQGATKTGVSLSRPCLGFSVPRMTAQEVRRGTAVAATMAWVAPHKAGGAAGREQPSPWRTQTCPPQLAQQWGFPRPHSSEGKQCRGPGPPPTWCLLLSNASDKGPGTRACPGRCLPMPWGAREPPSKRPPCDKSQVATSSDLAGGSVGAETRWGGGRGPACGWQGMRPDPHRAPGLDTRQILSVGSRGWPCLPALSTDGRWAEPTQRC